MLGMPSISCPRIDYAALRDPVRAAIQETVGEAWNIETPHFQLYKTSYHIITDTHHDPDTFRTEIASFKPVQKRLFPQDSAVRGRVSKLRFAALFNPLDKTCAEAKDGSYLAITKLDARLAHW